MIRVGQAADAQARGLPAAVTPAASTGVARPADLCSSANVAEAGGPSPGAREALLGAIRDRRGRQEPRNPRGPIPVVTAGLGNAAGLAGAAARRQAGGGRRDGDG